MIKGHVKIELKDKDTGEVETVEQDNLVTNAMVKLLGLDSVITAYGNNSIQYLLPVAKRGLGGLFMFDGILEESEDNIHFPMDVHLTGSAGQVSNTASKIIGSLNAAETGVTDTGFTTVWDFSTSQANGTIASLALTDYKGGEDPFNYAIYYSSNISMNSSSNMPIAYNSKTGEIYFYRQGSIYKKGIYTNVINSKVPYFSEEVLVKVIEFKDVKYNYWSLFNGYDGYMYLVYSTGHSSKQTITIRIRKFKIDDFSFEEQNEHSFSIENVTNNSTTYAGTSLNDYWSICKGYLYFMSYDDKTVYKVNLSNVVDIKEITFEEDMKCIRLYPRYNGGLYAQVSWPGISSTGSKQTYYSLAILYPDGKLRYKQESTSNGSYDMNGYCGLEGDNLFLCRFNQSYIYPGKTRMYLGTICNLATPVVKTSAQSMKVTYTLTDVTEASTDNQE